jgi:CTP:molybdopterin cytidylyltransferase MocA
VSTAGIILAAGESRRMGFPKALLRYRDRTFLDVLTGLLGERCSPVIVVLGAHAERIREGTLSASGDAEFILNPDYARGMTTSLQCGLRAIPETASGVLFTLVDHPAVSPATLDALLAGDGARVRVPRYSGRRGHPIWFSRELIPEFLALPIGGAASDVVRAHAAETEFMDVDDPGILADIDDAEAYRKLTGASL